MESRDFRSSFMPSILRTYLSAAVFTVLSQRYGRTPGLTGCEEVVAAQRDACAALFSQERPTETAGVCS